MQKGARPAAAERAPFCLFGEDFRFKGGNKGGIAVVRSDKNQHAVFIAQNRASSHGLAACVYTDVGCTYRCISAHGRFAVGVAAGRRGGWGWQVGEALL